MCPQYMSEIYKTTNQDYTVTRNSSLKLFQTLGTKAFKQKYWNGFFQMILNCQAM